MAGARFQIFTRRYGRVEWRLVGANNWVLGRSGTSYPTAGDALLGVARLKLELDAAPDEMFVDRAGGWRWELRIDDDILAVGHRVFRGRGECRGMLARFREVAAVAPVDAEPRVFR